MLKSHRPRLISESVIKAQADLLKIAEILGYKTSVIIADAGLLKKADLLGYKG